MPATQSPSAKALQSAIRQVARGERRLLLLHGVATFLSVVFAAALLAGLTDYLFRLRDPGLRWGLSLLTFSVAGAWFWKRVWPTIGFRRSDVSTAQRIESCFPQVGDRVSTAVAFLTASRPETMAGSAMLRQSVVDQAWSDVRHLALAQCLTRLPSLRALARLGVVVLVILGMAIVAPESFRLAARRLTTPWGDLPWPRRHVLQFIDTPDYLGPGEDFEAHVVDHRGELPETVTMELWFDGDPASRIQSRPMRYVGGRMAHRMSNVQRSFQYRATGGDDDSMPWRSFQLIEPPRLEFLEIQVTPPQHLGALPYQVTGLVNGLVGSKISLRGKADRGLTAVRLHIKEETALRHPEAVAPWPGRLNEDRHGFQFPNVDEALFELFESGSYWLELVDEEGRGFLVAPGELQALVDQPPSVRLLPVTRDGIVTPQARLELSIVAEDDFAIASVDLQLRHSSADETTVPVWRREERPSGVSIVPPPAPDVQRVIVPLELESLRLVPGDVLELRVSAADYVPQASSSSEQRLRIVSREEFEQRLAQQQSELVGKIQEVIRLQEDAQRQVESLAIELRDSGEIHRATVDRLQSAELNQRRVPQRIHEDHDSILSQIRQTREDITRNQLDRPDVQQRLAWLADELGEMAERSLPGIQHELLEAIKLMPSERSESRPFTSEQESSLREAAQSQREVLEQLEAIGQQLAEWENYHRFSREADQLWREQMAIRENTEKLQPMTVGREQHELEPAERASLKRLEMQQADLTRRFEHLLERLTGKEESLVKSEPELAEHLAAGSRVARDEDLARVLREITRRLEQNQLGQAISGQQSASEGLEQVSRALAGLPPRNQPDLPMESPTRGRSSDSDPEQQRLREQFERLLSEGGELAVQQQILIQATDQLVDDASANVELPPARVAPLATRQRDLQQGASALRNLMSDSPLFAWQLERIAREMSHAASELDQRAFPKAGAHQRRSARYLQDLLQAAAPLAEQEPASPENSDGPDDENAKEPDLSAADEDRDARPRLGLEDLRLLRSLQAEILDQTRELASRESARRIEPQDDNAPSVPEPSPSGPSPVAELAGEQQRLSQFLLELLEPRGAAPRPQPEASGTEPRRSRQQDQKLLDDLDEQLFPK